jgi:hypothetical protein
MKMPRVVRYLTVFGIIQIKAWAATNISRASGNSSDANARKAQ